MKIQLLEQGGKYFIRGFFLGFIPVYYVSGYNDGWKLIRDDVNKVEADRLIKKWTLEAAERKAFKESKIKILTEIDT